MSDKEFLWAKGDKDKDYILETMRRNLATKKELDKFLETLITPVIKDKQLNILDAGCGIGHISYWLQQISPLSNFVGIDNTPYLIEEARKLFPDENVKFAVGDIYKLNSLYPPKFFDVAVNWKVLSWIPSYNEVLAQLIQVTKSHIFISSLFYDGDIDFQVRVREYQLESSQEDYRCFYNVYSYPRFEQYAYQNGAKHVEPFDFEISVDLPRANPNLMDTYTMKTANGKRLQIAGAILMMWKVIRIDL